MACYCVGGRRTFLFTVPFSLTDQPFFFSSHWFFNFHFPLRTPLANKVTVLIACCLYERWGGGVGRWKTTKSLSTSTNSVCPRTDESLTFESSSQWITFTKTMSCCMKASFDPPNVCISSGASSLTYLARQNLQYYCPVQHIE